MDVHLESVQPLRFDNGRPVRSASGVAVLGHGLLVVQDDANHAAWWRADGISPVRLFPAHQGLDDFGDDAGTKHLKPDLEAACPLDPDGAAVLLLGSGSSPARTRCALVRRGGDRPDVVSADLAPVYRGLAAALELEPDLVNVEGACVVGESLRLFQRGLPAGRVPSASVDLALDDVLAAVRGELDPGAVAVAGPVRYELGEVAGHGLAVTDAVVVGPRLLVSAAAEATADPREDGPVAGSVLATIEGGVIVDAAPVPAVAGRIRKVEGLTVLHHHDRGARVLAVVDADDPQEASLALHLQVTW